METETEREGNLRWSKFKSYYVVWKLHMTENKNITQAKFKSYYVVWKPQCFHILRCAYKGLNRTM